MILRIALALALGFATLAALAAPVPKELEKLGPPTEKERKESRQKLRKIAIAIHNWSDVNNNVMPNNVCDKDGKPVLSWRVLILPYLDEEKLFAEFRLDESWDSKNNKALIDKIPIIYKPIRVKSELGNTFYRGFNGPDTIFETGKKWQLATIPDGTSNTIMVVEADEPCIWTKPDDLPYDSDKTLPKLGGMFEGDFHVAMADGSVLPGNSEKMNAAQFHLLITCSDGNVVNHGLALGHEKKKK